MALEAFQEAQEMRVSEGITEEADVWAALLKSKPRPVLIPVDRPVKMSRVLPGLGQAYLGNSRDGALAFLVNLGSIYQAVSWLTSGFETGAAFLLYQGGLRFYKGNLYNTARQTIERNQAEIQSYLGDRPGPLSIVCSELERDILAEQQSASNEARLSEASKRPTGEGLFVFSDLGYSDLFRISSFEFRAYRLDTFGFPLR